MTSEENKSEESAVSYYKKMRVLFKDQCKKHRMLQAAQRADGRWKGSESKETLKAHLHQLMDRTHHRTIPS